MRYDIAQIMIPPDKKHNGIAFYSTETKLVNELLKGIQAVTTNNAKFEPYTLQVDTVTAGIFTSLVQKDASIGWLLVKLILQEGWELFSTCVDAEFSSLFFKLQHT